MKNRVLLSVAAAALLFCGTAAAQTEAVSTELLEKCPSPAKPAIPNGRTATEDEMLTAQNALKTYLKASDDYIACLHRVEAAWGEEATEEQRAVVVLFHNRQVDEMHATGDLFNQAVRAFKGK